MQKGLGLDAASIPTLNRAQYYITIYPIYSQTDSQVHQWDSLSFSPSVFSHVHLFVFTVVITTMVVWTVAMNMNLFRG